jgi:heptosyltransferase-1
MRILIVKLSSLGDVVQTMPVVADILAVHPDAQIDWVVEEGFAPLLERVIGVHRVIPIGLRRWKKSWFAASTRQARLAFKADLQSTKYDVVMDCQGLIKSALVARLASLTEHGLRGSFANQSDACGYEWPVKFLLPNNQAMPRRIHAVARTRLLAAKLLGYQFRDAPQVAFHNLPARTSFPNQVMLTHGTTRQDNEWPLHSWEKLAEWLIQQGTEQILLPHANERELRVCEAIAQHIGSSAFILPRMGLSELLDAMAACQGVIGVDSGLSHMAVALGLPHVQIFSHDRAWRAGPVDTAYQLAVGGEQAPTVQDVIAAWSKVTASLAE